VVLVLQDIGQDGGVASLLWIEITVKGLSSYSQLLVNERKNLCKGFRFTVLKCA
jgi:hypothetical protein